jgi:excisionase family DNA binding protein
MSDNCAIRRADVKHEGQANMRTSSKRRERRGPERIGLQQAADYCDVDYRTIRRWVAEGRLNGVRIGPKLIKVDVAELDALMTPIGGGAA